MSEQTPQQPAYHDDEIDLRKLFQAIGGFFVSIGRGFIRMILAVRRATIRYKVLLGAALVLGVIAGVVFNKVAKPFYQTSLLLKSDYLNAKLVENGISKLNLLCEEKERVGLAKVLNISEDVARNIVDFEYEPFVAEDDVVEIELLKQKLEELKIDKKDINKIVDQIEIENRNTYLIKVHIYDVNIIENLQETLVGYFRNNAYVANRIKANKARMEDLIAKLTQDLSLLDSLKEAYNLSLKAQATNAPEASNNIFLGENNVNPVQVYSQGVRILEMLQETKMDYELGSDFELIDGFTTFSKPESPSLVKSIAIFMGIFLALGYLLIMAIEINKYLNRIETEGFRD